MKNYINKIVPCRECGKNIRKNGSSRCENCSDKYSLFQAQKINLQRKVDKQIKINNLIK